MDTKKLKYFLTVAEELNISKAARRLGIGQPVLSRAIKELEEKLEVALFFRDSGTIKLTPAGEVFLRKVDEALLLLEEGVEAVRQIKAEGGTVLDVGYLPSSYESFVGDVVNVFCQAFASTRLNLHALDAGPMLDRMRAGKLDVAFVGHVCAELEREFDAFLIWNIPMCVVVAEHHALANAGSVTLEQLAESPLISLNAESYPGRHEFIVSLCREAGFTPKILRRVDSLLSALATIAGSDGFSLMPREVEQIASKHVRFLKMESPKASVAFHAIVRKGESRKILLTLLNESRRIATTRAERG